MIVSLPRVGRVIHCRVFFPSCFCLRPGHRKGLEDKTYPTIDPPIHGEPDGVSCIFPMV